MNYRGETRCDHPDVARDVVGDGSFSPAELRQAVEALGVIEAHGDPDEWAHIMREATAETPSANPLDNAPIGARVVSGLLARRVSSLLGEPLGRCEAAAAEVYGRSRQRATFDAILAYADELESTVHVAGATTEPAPATTALMTIRLVSAEKAVG